MTLEVKMRRIILAVLCAAPLIAVTQPAWGDAAVQRQDYSTICTRPANESLRGAGRTSKGYLAPEAWLADDGPQDGNLRLNAALADSEPDALGVVPDHDRQVMLVVVDPGDLRDSGSELAARPNQAAAPLSVEVRELSTAGSARRCGGSVARR